MCVLPLGGKPARTRLVNVPVEVDGAPWTLLLYTNDLEVTPGSDARGLPWHRGPSYPDPSRTDADFCKVAREGKLFNPASSRYPATAVVICGKCKTYGITPCIGLGKLDLCLPCAGIFGSYPGASSLGEHSATDWF